MARTGLTNFVVWALATLCLAFFLVPRTELLLVAGLSLVVAWATRYWPEALGVAAGVAAVFLFDGLAARSALLPAAAIASAVAVVWRGRLVAAGPAPQPAGTRPNGSSTGWRLGTATLVAAFAIFAIDFLLALAFGITKC